MLGFQPASALLLLVHQAMPHIIARLQLCPCLLLPLPFLQDMPAKYIFEPWTAPLAVQQAAGCIIGKDYPQ
jgi:hypothetical protein